MSKDDSERTKEGSKFRNLLSVFGLSLLAFPLIYFGSTSGRNGSTYLLYPGLSLLVAAMFISLATRD